MHILPAVLRSQG